MQQLHPNRIRAYRLTSTPPFQSQQDLADHVGCQQWHISAYERGRIPTLLRAFELSIVLGKNVHMIFHELEAYAAQRLALRRQERQARLSSQNKASK